MRLSKVIIILTSLTIFFSCKTKKDKILGQQSFYASENFKVVKGITVNKKQITFSKDAPVPIKSWLTTEDSIVFEGEYNEKVTTKITIRGMESGAVRTLSIDAKELNINNASWRGEHERFDFFRKEKVLVSYEVLGFGEVKSTDTIEILGPQLYRSGRNFALPAWSFENRNGYDQPQNQSSYFQPYGRYEGDVDTIDYRAHEIVDINTPNGKTAIRMESIVRERNGFLGVGYTFTSSTYRQNDYTSVQRYKYFIKESNPDEVFFNIYVYSPVSRPATRLVAVIAETDLESDFPSFDVDGPAVLGAFLRKDATPQRLEHDRKLLNITMNFTGWKLFSFRYSDIPFATNKFYGGNGNKINEPQSVSLIDFNLEADFPGRHYAYVDFPIITYGGPFDPTKLK